jgi:hypothetical protein
MMFKHPPDLSHLRVIGCQVYVHQAKNLRTAIDPTATVGWLVGYARDNNGYRILMNIKSGKVVET